MVYLFAPLNDIEDSDEGDWSEIEDSTFIEMAQMENGHIAETFEELEGLYNSQKINTTTHQLRVLVGGLDGLV